MKRTFLHRLLTLVFALAGLSANAQNVRMSEAEIQLETKYLEGVSLQQIGKIESAAKVFGEILEKNPKCDACFFQLSRIYDQMNVLPKAVDFGKKAIVADAQNRWYKINLASIYEKTGQDLAAADLFKNIIETDGKKVDEDAYLQWGYYLVRAGEPTKALKVYNDLEQKQGISEELTRKKFTLYDILGDTKRASAELQRLCNKYSDNLEYWHLLAEYYQKTNQTALVAPVYQRILQLDPNDAKANLALQKKTNNNVQTADKEVAYLESLKTLFQNPAINVDDKVKELIPFVQKIAATHAPDLTNAAIVLADILQRTHPNEGKVFALQGDLFFHADRFQEALSSYQNCTQRVKNIFPVWEQEMRTAQLLANFNALENTANTVVDLFPNQAAGFYYLGIAQAHSNKIADALETLQQAALMTAKKPSLKQVILLEMANIQNKQRDYANADKTFTNALALAPNAPEALLRQAIALLQRNQPDLTAKAQTLTQTAQSLLKDDDATAWEYYGDAVALQGNRDAATTAWQRAKTLGGRSATLDKKIAEKNFVE
jgi:predicted Zn-dependent protease